MATNDLTDSLMDHVVDMIENGLPQIQDALSAKGYDVEIKYVWKDTQKVIDAYPCIVVAATKKEPAWFATRVRDETYRFQIDCMSKILKKEEAARFNRCFGAAVQNWLNDFYNLRTKVKGTDIITWDSFAPDLTYGYANNGAIRVARIEYFTKVSNPVTAPV